MQKILITKITVEGCKECEYIKWAVKRITELFCKEDIEIVYEEVIDNNIAESPVFKIQYEDKNIEFKGLPDTEELKMKCYEKYHTACGKEFFKFMDYNVKMLEVFLLFYMTQVIENQTIIEEIKCIDEELKEVFK